MNDEYLEPINRAEDILLGSLGFGEDARLVRVEATGDGYRGEGVWSDGEEFSFEYDDEVTELIAWALKTWCEEFGTEKRSAA